MSNPLISKENPDHLHWMARAMALAQHAASAGEVPVGAVLVRDGELLAEGWNQSISTQDPTAHAEVVVLRKASEKVGNYRLPGSTLYVTLEPCSMCSGAMVQARCERVVFATREPRSGAVVSQASLLEHPMHLHRVAWEEGPMAVESAELLRAFFKARR